MIGNRFSDRALFTVILLLIFLSLRVQVSALQRASNRISGPQPPPGQTENIAETPFTLTVAAHEIVVSVIAIDSHNRPVTDMQPSDFQIYELGKWSKKSPQPIASFHIIDRAMPKHIGLARTSAFRIRSNEGCAIGSHTHYQIAFHPGPAGLTPGYHDVLVKTSRSHVRLLFRPRYYVGRTEILSEPAPSNDPKSNAELQVAACYHPLVPPSLRLSVEPLAVADKSGRFSLSLPSESLAWIPRAGTTRQVQLDFGICTFDADGLPLNYKHASVERALTAPEYQQSLAREFEEQLELSTLTDAAMVRFVVRDHNTGNLGTFTLAIPSPARDALYTAQREESNKIREDHAQADIAHVGYLPAPAGPIRSFGSVVPQPGAMCGDVYELPEGISGLPDFWALDPIGTVYTDELDVPAQNIRNSSAIPGVTPKVDWFGIDYYGEFQIETAGDYTFRLFSDDGAKLYIDDKLILDLDGLHDVEGKEGRVQLNVGEHMLHLPYMEGPGGMALILLVKPPSGQYRVFNTQDFGQPAGAVVTSSWP